MLLCIHPAIHHNVLCFHWCLHIQIPKGYFITFVSSESVQGYRNHKLNEKWLMICAWIYFMGFSFNFYFSPCAKEIFKLGKDRNTLHHYMVSCKGQILWQDLQKQSTEQTQLMTEKMSLLSLCITVNNIWV